MAAKKPDGPRGTKALAFLEQIAGQVYNQLQHQKIPEMDLPTRVKQNIVFDPKHQVWKYGEMMSTRTAKTLDGAMMLLRTMYMADFIKEMIETKKSSTLRELYYISEGWEMGKFNAQDE